MCSEICKTTKRGRTEFEWKLQNFSSLIWLVNHFYDSPNFEFLDRTFYLRIYPNGTTLRDSEGWISLFLMLSPIPESHPTLDIPYSLSIKKASGETKLFVYEIATFKNEYNTQWGNTKTLKTKELLKRSEELMPKDVLTIIATLEEDTAGVSWIRSDEFSKTEEKVEERQPNNLRGLTDLSSNLKDLYVTRKNFDVTLKVGEKKFGAHRLILGARTPVFAAMFSHNMTESETGVVCVEDCIPEAFEVFLLFMYTGVAENLTGENVNDVYYIADKYDLPVLKEQCVQNMLSNLTIDSICPILALASRHGEEVLLQKATEYFVENARKVYRSAAWPKFMSENVSLANELIVQRDTYTK